MGAPAGTVVIPEAGVAPLTLQIYRYIIVKGRDLTDVSVTYDVLHVQEIVQS